MDKIMQSTVLRFFVLIAIVIGATSCKKNKKLSELSDPEAEKEQMEQEMESDVKKEEPKETKPLTFKLPEKLTAEQKLNNYFSAIANATSTSSANNSIQEALSMFSTPDAPLLIVFYEANGKASYDEPTTIEKYLNYLKDTRNAKARVEEVVTDESGKIREIVLKK